MLSELGDKSQISTIYLSATVKPLHVFIASVVAQYILSIMAIFFGNFIADKVSERNLTIFAGIMFLVFAIITTYSAIFDPVVELIVKIPAKLDTSSVHSSNFTSLNSTLTKLNNLIKNTNNTINIESFEKYLNNTNH